MDMTHSRGSSVRLMKGVGGWNEGTGKKDESQMLTVGITAKMCIEDAVTRVEVSANKSRAELDDGQISVYLK